MQPNPAKAATPGHADSASAWTRLRRVLPVAVLVLGFAAFFAFDLEYYLTFHHLRMHRAQIMAFVAEHGMMAPITFMLIYVVVVALSVPVGAFMSVTSGFLFGVAMGATYNVIAATIGAALVFLIAKTAFGDPLRARAGPFLKRMESGFRQNALSYLLVLRFVPLFPFFIVNLVPAFLGVRVTIFVLGTFIGIMPASVVYALAGAGLGAVFDAGSEFSAKGIFTPEMVVALIGLALLSLVPVFYRKMKRND
ncbi:MAG: TVP38/TMEM64 family protein [Proteobacteria bacterium]|nr:TVP38/TMEM64 family protein [Pseudomonadota bacterium]MBI3499341.1 TVP38/TMEM64 family protein [Pseudomonadota bacterium]